MKLSVRILNLGVLFIMILAAVLQLISFSVRKDEIEVCTNLAMTSTQLVMQEQIADEMYGTNTRRKTISSNEEYLKEFSINFDKLVTSDTEYKVKVYGIDYTKGFIDIEVEGSFKMLNGDYKTVKVRKTSVVDILK